MKRSGWRAWVVDRFGLKPIWDYGLDRRVPKSPWYFGDGATLLLLLGVQVGTGAFMTLTYSPAPDAAYDSVWYITHVQTLGWLLRGLHYWGAGMMVVVLIFHVLRQIFVGGYKFPREGTWLVGVALFFGVMVMAFTGYTLRWDERAVAAIGVVLHMFARVPWIGEELVLLVQGGPTLGALTLSRFYAVHVVMTPLLLLFLAGYHVYLVILKGTTAPAEFGRPVRTLDEQKAIYEAQAHSPERGETFFPETWVHSARFAIPVFLVVVALAVLAGPQTLEPEANRIGPARPREEWWFWWYSALIALVPAGAAQVLVVALPLILLVAMLLLPFVDRSPYRGFKKRPVAVGFVVVVVLGLLYLTNLRYDSEWTGWPVESPPPVPAGVTLTGDTEAGRILFNRYGCTSCHAVAGYGPGVGPDLAKIGGRRSQEEIRRFILEPPAGVPMPAYRGRIPEDDLARIVAFVHVAQTFPRAQTVEAPPVEAPR